jgi:membrane protein implicated in regulation of membrane protease activity
MLLSYTVMWLLAGAGAALPMAAALKLSPSVFWLVVGAMLCLIEVVVPTAFTAFVMGLSALAVAMIAGVLPYQVNLQVGLWIGFSTAFVFLTHRFMPKRKVSAIAEASEALTLTEILPGQTGRVLYEGNSWRARCGEPTLAIAPQQKVYVVGREGTTLLVVPATFLDA